MGHLRTSAPPAAEEIQVWVLHVGAQLRTLRAELRDVMTERQLPFRPAVDGTLEIIELVATELATNAIKYGAPPTVIRLLGSDGHLVLDVADHDVETLPETLEAQPTDSGGRGLMLTQSFASDLGWYITDTTKHIWASFDATP